MIKLETDTVQPADERQTDKDGTQSQDRQPERTQARAEHDEHAQNGATRAQDVARRRLKGKG